MTFLPCWKVTEAEVLMLCACPVAGWGGHRLCVANASFLQKGDFLLAQKQSRQHPLEGRALFIAPERDLNLPSVVCSSCFSCSQKIHVNPCLEVSKYLYMLQNTYISTVNIFKVSLTTIKGTWILNNIFGFPLGWLLIQWINLICYILLAFTLNDERK